MPVNSEGALETDSGPYSLPIKEILPCLKPADETLNNRLDPYLQAQSNLGMLYYNGHGVPQDYAIARQWYEQAAAQGDAQAQSNLGYLYFDGKGVPKDEQTGVEWIRKAAEQGDANGQDSLGEMYRDGRGVSQDNVRAYMWFNLAAALSKGDAQKSEANKRDKVAQQMTPAQIAEAQRLSQQCQAQQYKGC